MTISNRQRNKNIFKLKAYRHSTNSQYTENHDNSSVPGHPCLPFFDTVSSSPYLYQPRNYKSPIKLSKTAPYCLYHSDSSASLLVSRREQEERGPWNPRRLSMAPTQPRTSKIKTGTKLMFPSTRATAPASHSLSSSMKREP